MTGRRPPELDELVDFPSDMRYQWQYFIALHNKRSSNGFEGNPISYQEMYSYFSLIGYFPMEWEIELISALDDIFLGVQRKHAEAQQKRKT